MAKAKYTLTEEERQRRSEHAKKMIAAGKMGGQQHGAGRPKHKRASEHVAEKAAEKAAKITEALVDGLAKTNSSTTRIKSALALLEIERKETELKMKERQSELDNMTKDQLIELLARKVMELKSQGINLNEFIVSRAEEVTRELSRPE